MFNLGHVPRWDPNIINTLISNNFQLHWGPVIISTFKFADRERQHKAGELMNPLWRSLWLYHRTLRGAIANV